MKKSLLVIATSLGLIFVALVSAPDGSTHLRRVNAQEERGARFALYEMPKPDFKRQAPGVVTPRRGEPRLVLLTAKANKITDVSEWFKRNGLALPIYDVADTPDGLQGSPTMPLPANVSTSFKGSRLIRAIRQPRITILIYGKNFSEGRMLIVMDNESREFLYGYDFVNYAYAPDYVRADRDYVYQSIEWAVEENGVLYVSHNHSTYARSSKGMNAYITAIKTDDSSVLWRSAPLVSNAGNFELIGDRIVSGYGFTNEADFMYLLDKRTGEVRQRLAVKSGPEHILRKGNTIYVRAYNMDMTLKLEGR